MTNTTIKFSDGSVRSVPSALAPEIIGLDRDGDVLVPFCGEFAPLTPCCNASGKGSDGGVVCRACYRPVSFKYGMTVPLVLERVCPTCDGKFYVSRPGGVCELHDFSCSALPAI